MYTTFADHSWSILQTLGSSREEEEHSKTSFLRRNILWNPFSLQELKYSWDGTAPVGFTCTSHQVPMYVAMCGLYKPYLQRNAQLWSIYIPRLRCYPGPFPFKFWFTQWISIAQHYLMTTRTGTTLSGYQHYSMQIIINTQWISLLDAEATFILSSTHNQACMCL